MAVTTSPRTQSPVSPRRRPLGRRVVAVVAIAGRRARAHRGERGQRRGGHRDVRVRRRAVPLRHAVLHAARDGRAGDGAGDGGTARRAHRQRARRADPGAVQPPDGRASRSSASCWPTRAWSSASSPASARPAACSACPEMIAIPIAAALLWALVIFGSYKRAQRVVPGAVAGVPRVPDRDGARPSTLDDTSVRAGRAAHARVERLHPARRGVDRDDGQPVHAVLRGGRRRRPASAGRQSASADAAPAAPTVDRLLRADAVVGAIFACLISITIIVATGTAIGGTGPLQSAAQAALALKPAAGAGASSAVRDRPDRRVRAGRGRGAAVHATRSARPSASSGRCRGASPRRRCSSACSRHRSRWARSSR